jgi:hypothetical protein
LDERFEDAIKSSDNMNIDPKARVRMQKDVLIQKIEGESILLNLATENYFALDEVGTSIVTTLDESDSVAAGVRKLLEMYEVEEAKLTEDITQLVNQCEQEGLLQVISA